MIAPKRSINAEAVLSLSIFGLRVDVHLLDLAEETLPVCFLGSCLLRCPYLPVAAEDQEQEYLHAEYDCSGTERRGEGLDALVFGLLRSAGVGGG